MLIKKTTRTKSKNSVTRFKKNISSANLMLSTIITLKTQRLYSRSLLCSNEMRSALYSMKQVGFVVNNTRLWFRYSVACCIILCLQIVHLTSNHSQYIHTEFLYTIRTYAHTSSYLFTLISMHKMERVCTGSHIHTLSFASLTDR